MKSAAVAANAAGGSGELLRPQPKPLQLLQPKTEGIAEGIASVDITSDNAAIAAAAKAEGIAEGVASVDITSDNASVILAAVQAELMRVQIAVLQDVQHSH